MTKRKHPDQLLKPGRKTTFLKQYVDIARRMAYLGATDRDLAIAFNCTIKCIWDWKVAHPSFGEALKLGKKEVDERVERSLYQRAVGYSYNAVKVMQNNGEPVYAEYVEHVPPDPGAAKLWLTNRRPEEWRDKTYNELTEGGNPYEAPAGRFERGGGTSLRC